MCGYNDHRKHSLYVKVTVFINLDNFYKYLWCTHPNSWCDAFIAPDIYSSMVACKKRKSIGPLGTTLTSIGCDMVFRNYPYK